MEKINLAQKFSMFDEFWRPKVIAELNGQYVKLAKLQGEFIWHHHDVEDELFLVVKGELLIKFRDRDVLLGEGDLIVVPAGVEHKPVAEQEAHVLLLEPKTTLNTGNVRDKRTVVGVEKI